MGKGTRGQGLQTLLSRGVLYSLGEQTFRDPSSAVLRCYVDADLHGRVVGGPLAEGLEAEPTSDLPFHLRNPDRVALRIVLVKPGEAALDGDGSVSAVTARPGTVEL
jgi:hypothetical protein